jgi:pantothenate kinase
MSDSLLHNRDIVCQQVVKQHRAGKRTIVAIAGPPAAGKSTLAQVVVDAFSDEHKAGGPHSELMGLNAALLPMDGFHLDNCVLETRGLLQRKGAPHTFDAHGFCALVRRLRDQSETIIHPVFDRSRDMAIAGAGVITGDVDIIIVEGNYLLLDADPWRSVAPDYDLTVFVSLPIDILEQRLVERWCHYGLDEVAARRRAELNDMPNTRLVLEQSLPAHIHIRQ